MAARDRYDTVWPLEPHTAAKHEILRRYLEAWFPILGSWQAPVVFLDGFAGPGRYSKGEPGSPVIALRTLLTHHAADRLLTQSKFVFLFCEADPKRCAALRAEVNRLLEEHRPPAAVQIQIVKGSFGDTAEQILATLREQRARLAPTFAFVDPFGISGISMAQIRDLLAFTGCEVMLNLAIKNLVRFVNSPEFAAHLPVLFGTDQWRDAVELPTDERRQFLVELYEQQLR